MLNLNFKNIVAVAVSYIAALALVLTLAAGVFFLGSLFIKQANAAQPTRIEKAVNLASTIHGVDADLILSVIEVESGFNPRAVGKSGEVGLMQLHPKFFPDASFAIERNVLEGVAYLAIVREECPVRQGLKWVVCYNQGTRKAIKDANASRYYQKIVDAYLRRKLKQQQ
jgi:soluble lytic murein transglycosylase-like protein